MRNRLVIAALGTAAAAALVIVPNIAHADDVTPKVIGGDTVSSAPWSAQVLTNGRFTCSGTIIAPRWVLTARHCIQPNMSVRVGNVRLGSGTAATVVRSVTRNDLALMNLATSIDTTFSKLASADPPVGVTNQIFGWGMTCFSGCQPSPRLKTANVRVSGFTQDAFGGRAIASTRINGNAWRGDSGGPQFYNSLQVGVASTADGQSRQNYGSVAFNAPGSAPRPASDHPALRPPPSALRPPPSALRPPPSALRPPRS
jgi:secreted trypsin-like serine protease